MGKTPQRNLLGALGIIPGVAVVQVRVPSRVLATHDHRDSFGKKDEQCKDAMTRHRDYRWPKRGYIP